MKNTEKWGTTVSKLIAQAWIDNSFYHRLIQDPAAVLREAGLILDDFAQVQVNLNSAADIPALTAEAGGTLTINLPPRPTGLADELLNLLFHGKKLPRMCCC